MCNDEVMSTIIYAIKYAQSVDSFMNKKGNLPNDQIKIIILMIHRLLVRLVYNLFYRPLIL